MRHWHNIPKRKVGLICNWTLLKGIEWFLLMTIFSNCCVDMQSKKCCVLVLTVKLGGSITSEWEESWGWSTGKYHYKVPLVLGIRATAPRYATTSLSARRDKHFLLELSSKLTLKDTANKYFCSGYNQSF